jgi:uncharacterized protein
MKEQIELLVKVQAVEKDAAEIETILHGVSAKLISFDNKLNDSEKEMAQGDEEIERLRKEYRTLETDVQTIESNVKKMSEKRRAVKTNKEYQSLLKEEEQLSKSKSQIEDQMLERLDQIELQEQSAKQQKENFSLLVEEIKNEKAQVLVEVEKNREALLILKEKQTEVTAGVDKKLLNKFNQIKAQQVSGFAMAAVKDAACQGCHVNIPPQMYNELQRFDSLKLCPNCHKIIYYKE